MSTDTDNVDADDLVPEHWREMITPSRWAQATHDVSMQYFEARVENMGSEEHLVEALTIEVSRDAPRKDRVAKLNIRLSEVRQ